MCFIIVCAPLMQLSVKCNVSSYWADFKSLKGHYILFLFIILSFSFVSQNFIYDFYMWSVGSNNKNISFIKSKPANFYKLMRFSGEKCSIKYVPKCKMFHIIIQYFLNRGRGLSLCYQ